MRKVISTEKVVVPVKGEQFLYESFVHIRISDGARDEWVVLTEENYNAIMRYLNRGKNELDSFL